MHIFTRRLLLFISFFLVSVTAKALTANFSADYISGCSPLVVHFTNSSTGATSYSWDLGNGTTSALTDVSGSYLTAGTYTVTLTAYGGGTSATHTLTITVYPSPTVSFYASDTSVCPGSPVTFISTTVAGVAGALSYTWNFGDGYTSTLTSPTHTYNTPGYYNITLVATNSQGCTSSLTLGAYVHVFTPATPSFSAASAYFCHAPATATFTNTSTGSGTLTYSWTFGDGATSTDVNPTHTYTAPGSYTVVLHVTDGNGCTDSIVHANYIYVGHLAASFTGPATACLYAPVTFINTSTTHISSHWNFGDGGVSNADTGIHAFSTTGVHTITLIVSDGYCSDTITGTINILPEPTGTFTTSPSHPCPAPSTVLFSATTSGTSVSWSYGDGGSGVGTTTSHTYATNGVDTVRMVVTDANGCKDTVVKYDTISDLVFVIADTPTSGCVPLTVNFAASLFSTVPTNGPYPYGVATYNWNFGDGSATSTASNPVHIYTAVGIYTVTATITTVNGCTAHDSAIISVGSPPVATFTATPLHVCYHHPVTFLATVISGPINQYSWNFGDGAGAVDSFPSTSHTFIHPGTFAVTLTPYDNGCPGAPYTLPDSIIVDSPMAVINFLYNCIPYTQVAFTDNSLGDNTHIWIFGDGTTSTLSNPTHNFPSESTYTVTLATYNIASGCRDTATATVNLIPPLPVMHASDTALCPGGVVQFTPTVTGGVATAYYWAVNGTTLDNDTGAVFNDTFQTRGLYTIRLIIRDGHTCFDTLIRNNYIIVGKPIDTFVVSPPTGCAPLHVTFTDASTDVTGAYVTNYLWVFGDGVTATYSTSPTAHTYTAAGTYSIREIVTDNIGCKDTADMTSAITAWKPHATYYASNTYPCIAASVHFTNTSVGITSSYWMFGDGDTSTLNSPNHTYASIGAYTVKLVVTDVHGCTDTASYAAYINVTKPHAGFYMDDSFSICPPLSVHYFNTSTGATGYAWGFGDGATSTAISPSDLYTTSGVYTVTMVATNIYGCKDTAYGHVNLYGYAGGFTYAPLSGCSPLTVTFHANIVNVPSIIWDYADGTTSSSSAIDSSVHVYTVPGAYVPKLILSDNTGCQNSSQGLDTIKVDGVKPGFKPVPNPVCLNNNVTFTDTSSSFFSTITTWNWTLPDGSTSAVSSPSYLFNTVGTFPVTLNVTDGWGCTALVVENVTVHPPPTITASPDTTVCVGDPATLEAYGGVSYMWAPAASVSCNPCQTTQATPTVVTVYTVTGTDAFGCQSTDTVGVHLRTNTISGAWGDTAVCRNVGVPLFDTGGTKYTWLPASGLSDNTIANPVATPSVTTQYMAIAQLAGCIPDTNYVTVTVYQLPTVNAGPDQYLVAGQVAQLQATGTLIAQYLWTPAETLSCDSCSNPLASMPITTTYTVSVTSDRGCKSSDTVTIYLHCDESQVFIPNSFTPNGDGQNDVFYPRGSGISTIKSFRIYNRWGELLFERDNININDAQNAWDGSYKGGSPRADVYVYVIDAVCTTGAPINLKGDVTIIR